jgi:general secretion pathway protein D
MSYELFLPISGAFWRVLRSGAAGGLAVLVAAAAAGQPAPAAGVAGQPPDRPTVAAPAAADTAPAPVQAAAADDSVTLNFVNADIDAVVKAIAELTGRNFVVDPKIKGTVNIVSARPVPKSLVYPTLLSALRMQGIVAIEGDNVVKLVPEVDARTQAPAAGAPATGGDNRLVTRVVTLRYESAVQLVNVLRPLIAPNNTIAAYPASNALVITDYADNLRRIERVIASLDQPPSGETAVVPLKNASAIDLVATVGRLLNETTAGQPVDATQRVVLAADPRSNSVLIRADNPARAARAKALVAELDTPGRAGGNMFVVYLKNADAVKVAQTLRAMLTGQESSGGAPGGLSPQPPTTGGGLVNTSSPQPAMSAAQALPFTPTSASTSFSAGGATISADAASNALLIMAPEPVYNNLRTIIDKLDVRRAQVFIEALIAEVSADKAAEFGIQWQALTGVNSTRTRVIGGTNFTDRGSGGNILDIAANLGSAGQGLNLGVIRGTISIPGFGTITNLALLARALETQVNANILSTPTILTLDNEEARIVVGENVPFITGQYAQTGSTSTVTPFQTIERRDVGLVLRVKPQIAEGGAVRINLYQEVSRVESQSASGPILQKRSLDSTVVVDDGGIAVLGGLMQDQLNDGSDKVPVAGDVPVIGQLFRYDVRSRVKTSLMIFLRPIVLRSADDGRALTSERYDYLRGQQEMQGIPPRFFWTDPARQPVMPVPMGRMPDTPAGATPPPQSPEPVGK